MRDRLENLATRQSRQAHTVEVARANYTSSVAVYEALQETADDEADRRSERSKRRIQVAFCVVIPAVLFLLGVPLFIEGRARGALSYMAIGFLLSVFAALMATGGFAMLFRPNKEEGARKRPVSTTPIGDDQDRRSWKRARLRRIGGRAGTRGAG